MSDDRPTVPVNLDFKVHWCEAHLEPLRSAASSVAVASAMLDLFDLVVGRAEIVSACGGVDGHLADPALMDRVLREFSPLCCLVGADAMDAIYEHVLHGGPKPEPPDPKVFHVPESKCPTCGMTLSGAVPLNHDHAPRPGIVTFCIGCGDAAVFDDDLRLRAPTPEERAEIDADPAMARVREKLERDRDRRQEDAP